ncbi:DNA polymerase III subunit gamma and tau [Phycicoccus sp. SLBN-51]|uniref:DNA polymerase III subunit gamma and tau n=1 Tax=Phycicoccus sp. SLBN-51 TaxID=2768447 RepID=UPI00114ED545|nr:DNA polymerase III subunit gamma and tau [Phycicoccus sp. SLBN-51]TQJ49201.1 DNA polymerase-3 subunit gamma/tau [Phycicoccus sp. SLBN-51]
MSTALYRRYRPETFADVIGQEHVTEPLMQALRTGRVNHAYLFSGPRGCGKTTSARILARCLNCEQGPTPEPCGTCDSCVALARGGPGTVDVIEIDAASHGGVDDARDLRERASYGPAQSRYKIYIIDEAHMVTPQGFNALLKIVEEPPEHVKFVFATTEPEKVIGTIRSRTHHYPFRLVPPQRLQDYMEQLCASEGVKVAPGVLSFVVRAGGGSVRDSLSVLDQLIAGSGDDGLTYESAAALLGFTDAELLDAIIDAFAAGDGAGVFTQIDRVIETGLDPRRFVEDLLERLRDLIVVAAVPDGAASVLRGLPEDQVERMRQQAAAFGQGTLSRAADIVNAGLTEMTGATAPRLQLELICARVLLPAASGESGYAARLDRIERRLEVGGVPTGAAPGGPGAGTPPARSAPQAAALPPSAAPPVAATAPAAAAPTEPEFSDAPAEAGGLTGAAAARAAAAAARATSPSAPQPEAQESAQESGRPAPAQPAPAQPAPAQPAPERSAPDGRADQGAAEPAAPAGQRPASAPERTAAPAAERPAAPAAAPAPAAGGIDTAAIRRAWPDVLTWLSRNKRVTWTLVSDHAHVQSYDGTRLELGIAPTALLVRFRQGPHTELVRQALIDVLGVDARVECVPVPEGQTPAGAGGQTPSAQAPSSTPARPASPQAGPATSPAPHAAGDPGLEAAARHTGEPGDSWANRSAAPDSAPSWASEPPPAADQGAAPGEARPQMSHLKRALAVVEAEGPAATPEARVADDSAASDDDEDIEGLGEVGRPVIERILGGRVIEES